MRSRLLPPEPNEVEVTPDRFRQIQAAWHRRKKEPLRYEEHFSSWAGPRADCYYVSREAAEIVEIDRKLTAMENEIT